MCFLLLVLLKGKKCQLKKLGYDKSKKTLENKDPRQAEEILHSIKLNDWKKQRMKHHLYNHKKLLLNG